MPEQVRRGALLLVGAAAVSVLTGCELRQAMYDQQKYEPMEASALLANGMATQKPVPGTVARGEARLDSQLYYGVDQGSPVEQLPMPVTRELLERGRERYDIFCSPCHDRTGSGNGMIVQRGFKQPPTYHQDRLRDVPVGYLYDVITNGYGAMYSHAARIPVHDRWAIVAYVRTLQLSQSVELTRLPDSDQEQVR